MRQVVAATTGGVLWDVTIAGDPFGGMTAVDESYNEFLSRQESHPHSAVRIVARSSTSLAVAVSRVCFPVAAPRSLAPYRPRRRTASR